MVLPKNVSRQLVPVESRDWWPDLIIFRRLDGNWHVEFRQRADGGIFRGTRQASLLQAEAPTLERALFILDGLVVKHLKDEGK